MLKFNAKLKHNFSNFYVYSDIASFTFIGDTVAPMLRVVPFQSKPDSCFFYKEFKALHYVSVSKSIVDQVHITLKTENGMIVPFVTGNTILKLHFVERKSSINTINKFVNHQFRTKRLRDDFHRRHYKLISKFNVGLKTLLREGLSEPEFYGDLVYKSKKFIGRNDFSFQFRKNITRYRRIGYNLNVMRHSA